LDGQCLDPWEPLGTVDAPDARSAHLAAWTGQLMIVWGGTSNGSASGALNSGGIYDPATFTWTATTIINAPSPRVEATAVWTGTELIVWGGRDKDGNFLDTGARFDPSMNAWQTLSMTDAPSARSRHTAVWTDSEMIIWGGLDGSNQLSSGARYKPSDDSWVATAAVTAPSAPRERHSAVWNGQLMLTYGGVGDTPQNNNEYLPNDGVPGGRSYDPMTDAWAVVKQAGEPSPRADHSAVFGKGRMLLFGGVGSSGYFSTGFKYENDKWVSFNGSPPSARRDHTAVWLDGAKRMIVWGGRAGSGAMDDGGLLDPLNNVWTKPLTSPLKARYNHTAVTAGEKMIVWGGADKNNQPLNDGAIYTP